MYELTEESRNLVFDYLEAHPDSEVWDALILWLRALGEDPRGRAGFELPTGAFFTRVPDIEVAVIYGVADEPQRVIDILRIG